ncbi:MAG TPA: DUF5131 family protein, partial [Micropepsaceae bacterium]|nr:DUF5131 family protein [Micropepsaceae bacterium]
MAEKTGIEWTDSTWNPLRARNLATGKIGWHCEHASEGCRFCYAEGINKRRGTGLDFKPGHRADVEIFLDEKMLLAPLRWKKPRMIFVNSMSDTFAEFVPDEMIDRIFAVMASSARHTFQVLTKRPARMRKYLAGIEAEAPERLRQYMEVSREARQALTPPMSEPDPPTPELRALYDRVDGEIPKLDEYHWRKWPLHNIWLGVSSERQQEADERIPDLLATPAAVRFVSLEPLLGPIALGVGSGTARCPFPP